MQYSFYLEERIFLAIFVIQAKTTKVLEAIFAFAESLSTSASALKLLSHQRYFDHCCLCRLLGLEICHILYPELLVQSLEWLDLLRQGLGT